MELYKFDSSQFPTITLKIYRNPENQEEINTLFKEWYIFYKYKKNMIFVIDVSLLTATSFPMKFIQSIVDFSKKIKQMPHYIVLTVFYFKSDTVKNIFNMILNIEKPIKPILITKEIDVIHDILNGQIQFSNVKDYSIKYPINMGFDDVVQSLNFLPLSPSCRV